jgi:uncharacterized protein YidB (DUF937 family)
MGLLDGLLGQVLGGMAQSGRRGAPEMGGLGDLLGQMGGMSGMPGAGMGTPPRASGASSGSGLGGAAMGALVMVALQMLQKNGGIGGVLGRMQQQGHGGEADSWVSTGQNLPITPDVLSQILGREDLGRAAHQAGLSPEEAESGLAEVFPEVINEMTPKGQVEPGSDDMVARALEILERNRRGA